MEKGNLIMHLIPEAEWLKVKHDGFYYPERKKGEGGFIPCASREQILRAAEFVYNEGIKLKLLYIDSDKVKAQVVYEDLQNSGEVFPHIYGSLNLDAVMKAVDFKPNQDAVFEFPDV